MADLSRVLLRSTPLLALLLILVTAAPMMQVVGAAPKADRSAAAIWVNCPGIDHCYGQTGWAGGTFGAATYIYVRNLTCSACSNAFLTQEMWLADTSKPYTPWTEVGYYSGAPDAVGSTIYFYAIMYPDGYYDEIPWGVVPPPDIGGYTGFKITRNRQGPNQLLIQAWSAGYWTNKTAYVTTGQGGTNWAGNLINIGSELAGYGQIDVSSNGDIIWKENQWQYDTGVYQYQRSDPSPQLIRGYHQPSWDEKPSVSSTGGRFKNRCCY